MKQSPYQKIEGRAVPQACQNPYDQHVENLPGGAVTAGEALARDGGATGASLMLGMPEVVVLCLYFYLLSAGLYFHSEF